MSRPTCFLPRPDIFPLRAIRALSGLLIFLLLALLWSPRLATASGTPLPSRPNFVIVLADDLGYGDIGPFGSKLNRTPHLDRMAKEGMRLTSFYGAPVCTPSRAQLISGCYPKRVSLPNVIFPSCPIGLNTNELTLPRLLQRQGYATFAIGKWHLGDQRTFLPTRQGFDHYFGLPYSNDMGPAEERAALKALAGKPGKSPLRLGRPGELGITAGPKPPLPLVRDEEVVETILPAQQDQLTERYTAEAVNFIRSHQQQPFFLYLAHTAVHVPLHPGAAFRGKSQNGRYGDWVEEVDWSVGRVLDTLRDLKLDQRTLVVFTSDNGPWLVMGTNGGIAGPLRGGKGSTWEGGVREPTVAWWPGQIAAGSACDAIMGNFDFLPTFVKLAGGSVPADRKIDGADIWPLLSGQSRGQVREGFYYFKGNRLEAVRSGPWKLALPGQGAGSSAKKVPSETPADVVRLYNLDTDIGESTDVAAQHPDEVRWLQKLIAEMDADLGKEKAGPGVRPPGRVAKPEPMLVPGTEYSVETTTNSQSQARPLNTLKLGDSLSRDAAPQIARKAFTIRAELEPQSSDGVILAHGGNTWGYALYLRGGKLVFTVRERKQPAAITAQETPTGRMSIEARLSADGTMALSINGRQVANGKAEGLITTQPQENFCLGFDDGQPVDDYPADAHFKGTITALTVTTDP